MHNHQVNLGELVGPEAYNLLCMALQLCFILAVTVLS